MLSSSDKEVSLEEIREELDRFRTTPYLTAEEKLAALRQILHQIGMHSEDKE